MRLITVRIQPAMPDLTAEGLTSLLGAAGIGVEHVYVDVSDSVTRIAAYVRTETAHGDPTRDAVVAALTAVAGEDRLVRARTHSWGSVTGGGLG